MQTWVGRHLRLLPALALATAVAACGGSSSPTSPTATGNLTVMLRDSPYSSAQALLVTFSAVAAHTSGGDFQTLPFSGASASWTCDLKRLNGTEDLLGTGALPAGHYTQIRLTITSATLYFDNPSTGAICAASVPVPAGASAPVTVPSGTVYVNGQFDVTADQTTTIHLDFNGDQSVRLLGDGSYEMTPVISVVSVQ